MQNWLRDWLRDVFCGFDNYTEQNVIYRWLFHVWLYVTLSERGYLNVCKYSHKAIHDFTRLEVGNNPTRTYYRDNSTLRDYPGYKSTYIHKLTPFSHGGKQKLQNATCYDPYINTSDHTRTPVASTTCMLNI